MGLLAVVGVLLLLNFVAQFGISCPRATAEEYEYPGPLIGIAAVPSEDEGRFLLIRAFEDGTVDVRQFIEDYRMTPYKWACLVEAGEFNE
jgi:hypothetical protein